MKFALLAVALTLSVTSCKKKDNNEETTETTHSVANNDQQIQDYLAKNNLTAKKTDSGLYYVITEEGTGAQPTAESNVTVAYKGYFTDGNVFDQSGAEGISFGLGQVIPGWTEGITYFKEGGKGMLLIPSDLGYGSEDRGPIPGNSVLIFDIHLIKVD
ncbi:FKBP-type peptidyl-prolyl cis-trans isomerase [Flavobacterium sp. NG2]|uniref:FKBP-type peptidyl-prolyl cis-trans isomerase n=1 Tax=Flavobacterium sp. NG2 TaxID=3097547 RepID=UPI002A8390BC|nr:FKBP-type peptidyl-prolyl cis-trans isomerase [Flavobacterium sp. NG2]WPR73206.1 FKBP-type peptidyl-prolyl cis-trans isomerase [Flavobacterium sp. NG2]